MREFTRFDSQQGIRLIFIVAVEANRGIRAATNTRRRLSVGFQQVNNGSMRFAMRIANWWRHNHDSFDEFRLLDLRHRPIAPLKLRYRQMIAIEQGRGIGQEQGAIAAAVLCFFQRCNTHNLSLLHACGLAAIFISTAGLAPLAALRLSASAPLATNSSLNLLTKLNTGQAQASPKAQMVRPWMFLAIWTR